MRGRSCSYTLYISINLPRAPRVIGSHSLGRDPLTPGGEGVATLPGRRWGRTSRTRCRGGYRARARLAPAHHFAGKVLARLWHDAALPEVTAQL